MRIVFEYWEKIGSTVYNRREVAEGTKDQIQTEILRRAGNNEVRIVGLHNTRADFEAYCGPVEDIYQNGFADSPR